MKFKCILGVALALSSVVSSAAFDETDKSAVREAVAAAEAKFKTAKPLDGKAITLLPVKGDSDGYCERLVIGALVNAGKTCVISNDEKKDERFGRILKEIGWDERQTTLRSIDPRTADELGHLKSTQILLEARLDVVRGTGRRRRVAAELNLLAYSVKTKQYVWTANIVMDGAGLSLPDAGGVNVKVVIRSGGTDSAALSSAVGGEVRNAITGLGYRVNAEGAGDLLLSLSIDQETFDRSGEYYVFKGLAKVRLSSVAGDGVLYEKTFSAKGARGLGKSEAGSNLAKVLTERLKPWITETLEPRAFFTKHRDFADRLSN